MSREQRPAVLAFRLGTLQVCVPMSWPDAAIESFANNAQPTGLDHGWTVAKGDGTLTPRVMCKNAATERRWMHVILEC